MKSISEIIEFLESHPHAAPCSKEEYAEQILSLEKKTRKDVILLLERGAFGEMNGLTELVKICKENKVSIKRIDEKQVTAYCNREVSAEQLIAEIQKSDLERLVPKYHDPPCKVHPKGVEKLRGK